MEIIPGVHKIDGVSGANSYLVTSLPEIVLIDTGMRGSGKKISAYLKQLGKQPADIKYIFVTHPDMDHVGGLSEIKKLTGAKVVIHAADEPALAGNNTSRLRNQGIFVKIVMRILAGLMKSPRVEPDIIVKEDITLAGLKIVHTPGHSDGSISIYLPGKVIFVGDALRSDAKGNPLQPAKALSADFKQAKESVKIIAGLDFDTLLAGHGAPVKGDAAAKVKNLLEQWK
jgi:glyoxylase-like metal-dependent hydrolase (beta-lactamase superfamily II)